MELQKHYIVFLKKGPTWTPDVTPELEQLQEAHMANQTALYEAGKMSVGGPVQAEDGSDLRGINIFNADKFESLAEVQNLMETDPMFLANRLVGEFLTWYTSPDALLGLLKSSS